MVPKVGLQELWSCEMLFRMKGSTDPSLIQQIFVKSLLNAWCWASLVAQMAKNLPTTQETRVDPWVGKISWRREWQPAVVFLPGEFHGQKKLVGYSLWDRKESDTTE